MNKKYLLATICMVVISLLFSAALYASETEVITTTGTVIALYDDADKVIGTSIEGIDGTYFDVSPLEKGKELMTLVDKKIEARGVISKDEDGYETLTVQSYKILNE